MPQISWRWSIDGETSDFRPTLSRQSSAFVQRATELRDSGLCDRLLRRVAASAPAGNGYDSLLRLETPQNDSAKLSVMSNEVTHSLFLASTGHDAELGGFAWMPCIEELIGCDAGTSWAGGRPRKEPRLDIAQKRKIALEAIKSCLLYTSPSPRDQRGSRMPSSA